MRSVPVMTAIFATTSLCTTACPNDPRAMDGSTGLPETSTTATEPAPTNTSVTETTDPDSTTAVSGPTSEPSESSTGSLDTDALTSSSSEPTTNSSGAADTGSSTTVGRQPLATTLEIEILPIKQFAFSWPPSADATHYQIHERATPQDAFVQLGEDVIGTAASRFVPLHLRSSASYLVSACNEYGCTDSPPVDVDSSLAEAIGYFKASNNKAYQYFGESVALAADGNTMVVGSPYEDSGATGVWSSAAKRRWRLALAPLKHLLATGPR